MYDCKFLHSRAVCMLPGVLRWHIGVKYWSEKVIFYPDFMDLFILMPFQLPEEYFLRPRTAISSFLCRRSVTRLCEECTVWYVFSDAKKTPCYLDLNIKHWRLWVDRERLYGVTFTSLRRNLAEGYEFSFVVCSVCAEILNVFLRCKLVKKDRSLQLVPEANWIAATRITRFNTSCNYIA